MVRERERRGESENMEQRPRTAGGGSLHKIKGEKEAHEVPAFVVLCRLHQHEKSNYRVPQLHQPIGALKTFGKKVVLPAPIHLHDIDPEGACTSSRPERTLKQLNSFLFFISDLCETKTEQRGSL
jgi:hypothetical protein